MHSSKNEVPTSANFLVSLSRFLGACRPKTLSAGAVPVLVGAALTRSLGFELELPIVLCILISALLIQIGTNLFNDALDFEKGVDQHTRLGPPRATQMGWFTPGQVKLAAFTCFLLALIVALPLVLRGGWPIVAIGLSSLSLGYLYTGGPRPLAYSGLGDFFVIAFFGVIAVMGTVYLLSRQWVAPAFVAGLQVGALSTVLIAINNFRDAETDRAARKMTLPARFGPLFAKYEIASMFALAFCLLPYWLERRSLFLLFLFLPSFVLATSIVLRAWRSQPGEGLNRLLHLAALTQMTFGLALAALLICR